MRGFTLLEVLIALLVVSITLAAANAAIGGTAARQRQLEDRTFAAWAAHGALARLRLDGFAGERTQIERTEGGRRLRVSVEVEPGDGLRQATLTVRPADGPAGRQNDEVLARLSGFLPLPDEPAPTTPTPGAAPDAAAQKRAVDPTVGPAEPTPERAP
ncbi:MAG: type IV pilus modification PilV family protein [Pseudomonadota bacterium]